MTWPTDLRTWFLVAVCILGIIFFTFMAAAATQQEVGRENKMEETRFQRQNRANKYLMEMAAAIIIGVIVIKWVHDGLRIRINFVH